MESLRISSLHRVDAIRQRFQIKVENDTRKQLWVLENQLQDSASSPSSEPKQTSAEASNKPLEMPSSTSSASSEPKSKKPKKTKPVPSEREDVAVKTKLANVTALAALGIQQKSWMTSQPLPSSFSSSGLIGGSSMGMDSVGGDKKTKWTSPYAGNSDKDFATKIANRTVNLQDLIFVMENDRHLSKSNILLQQYFHLQ